MNDLQTPTQSQPATMQTPPMGLMDRVKKAVEVMRTGKAGQENPLAKEPDDKSRAALVIELNDWWMDARKFWKPVFLEIEKSMKFAGGQQYPKGVVAVDGSKAYQADIVQRHLAQKESLLYAKNPTFEARRRERLEFAVWDGTQETLQGAKAMLQKMGPALQAADHAKQLMNHADNGVPITNDEHQAAQNLIAQEPPEAIGAQQILADYEKGMKQKAYEDAVGDTLRLLFKNQIEAQNPPFKLQCKQLITRVNTCRVGYVKLLLQREMTGTPTATAVKSGMAETLATMQALVEKMTEPGYDPESGDMAELELMVKNLQAKQEEQDGGEVESEGVVLDFLPATSVILDKNCRSLRGFVGCKRICHEILMDVEDVEREFDLSLTDSGAVLYTRAGDKSDSNRRFDKSSDEKEQPKVLVGYIEDRTTGLCYVVCDGVKDFLKEPYAPQPDWDFFFTIIPLTFRGVEVEKNDPENDLTCYPKSDVELLMPMQKEKNRSRERFIEHREAKKPGFVAVGNKFSPGDIDKLKRPRQANEVVILDSFVVGDKIGDLLQPIPTEEIDPKVYDDGAFIQDVLEVVGSQQADLGPTNGDTATQSRIAAQAKMTASNSNVDDLDEFLTLLAKGMCKLLMDEMQEESVKKIVGPGAVWPQLSMKEMAENVWLEIQAGSSGPPNQQLDMEVAKQMIPMLMQLPGISPELLARFGARALDPRIRIEDFYQKDSPSIDALNQAKSQPPPTKESVSISYKDVPPSVQRQMEAAAGFKPADEMNGTAHMASYTANQKPKPAPAQPAGGVTK